MNNTEDQIPTKVAAYYRRSTNIQENSIEMQQQLAFEKSIEHSLPIDEEYPDDAISARKITKNNRKKLDKLLREIEDGKIHTLFVYKRDRLARNSFEYLQIYNLLQDKKVNVIFTCDTELPMKYDPTGELIEAIMAGIIQREGEQIVQRITESIKANFKSGKNTGPLPYGYDYNKSNKTFTKIPSHIENVKTIFELLLSERFSSLTELRKELEKRGIKKDEKPFTNQTIKKILRDSTYIGIRKLNIDNETLVKRFEQLTIVDEEQWNRAQVILDQIAPSKNREPLPETDYLLENVLLCSVCKRTLIGKASRKNKQVIFRYKCKEHKNIIVDKEEVEEKVLAQSYNFFAKLLAENFKPFFNRYINQYELNTNDIFDRIDNKIKELNKQLNDLTEKWFHENRTDKKEKYENRMLSLYEKVKEQKEIKDALLDEIADVRSLPSKLEHIKDTFALPLNNLPIRMKKQLLNDVIHEVIVKPNTIKIIFKHPFLERRDVISQC